MNILRQDNTQIEGKSIEAKSTGAEVHMDGVPLRGQGNASFCLFILME